MNWRNFSERPFLILVLGVVLGIVFGPPAIFCGLIAFYRPCRWTGWIGVGALLGSIATFLHPEVPLPNPSGYTGSVRIASFPQYRDGSTLASVNVSRWESKIKLSGEIAVAPGDVLFVESQASGERRTLIVADKYSRVKTGFFHESAKLRLVLIGRIRELYGPSRGSWVNGILFNFPGDLSKQDADDLRNSGTYHLISASGIHVFVLASALMFVLASLRIPRDVQLTVVLVALFGYCLITGLNAPTVRAALMWYIGSIAYLFRRSPDGVSAISLSATIWLCFQPSALYSPGFQLSYIVTTALLLLFESTFREDPSVWNGFKVSVIAMLASEPIIAWWFGRLSFISPIANLLIEIPSTLILILGILSLIPWVGPVFALAATPMIDAAQVIASTTSQFPALELRRYALPPSLFILYYLCLVVILMPRAWTKR